MKVKLATLIITLSFLILLVSASVNKDDSQVQDAYDDYDDDYNTVAATVSKIVDTATETDAQAATAQSTVPKAQSESAPTGPQYRSPKNFQEILQRIYSLKFSQVYREAGLIGLLLVYFAVYYQGSNVNEAKGKAWLKASIDYFTTQFAQLGDERGFFLMRNGPDDFIFYASGRVGCKLMYGHIYLFPRHDVIKFLYSLYAPISDHVSISIPLPDDTDAFIFSILSRQLANQLRRDRHDINIFTKQTTVKSLPQGLVVLTEHSDITNQIISPQLAGSIAKIKDELLEVVISDQPSTKPTTVPIDATKILTFKYKLTGDKTKLDHLHRFLMELVDHLHTMPKLRLDVKNKLKKIREDAYKELAKEETQLQREEVENRVAERRRKELEQVMKMSPDAQRKFEEKEARKKGKKTQGKVMIRG